MNNSDRLIPRERFALIDSILVGVALVAAYCSADQLRFPLHLSSVLATRLTIPNLFRAIAVFSFWAVLMRYFRTYTAEVIGAFSEALRIGTAVGITAVVLSISFGQGHKGASAVHLAADFALFSLLTMYGLRAVVALLTRYSGAAGLGTRQVLIVGTGPRAVRTFRYVRTHLHRTHSVFGFVDCRSTSVCPGEIESKFLGPLASLRSLLLNNIVDEVIIALPARSCYSSIVEAIEVCASVGLPVKYPNDIFPSSFHFKNAQHHPPMIVLRATAFDGRLLVKRFLDIVISLATIAVLSPFMVLIALLIKRSGPGAVFSRQEYFGVGRRRFFLYRFRTSISPCQAPQNGESKPTRFGVFLLRLKLDRLPQLFNVLAGHMSLVGPRAMSVQTALAAHETSLMRRFSVKPGVTGLWQVRAARAASFQRFIEFDLHYIDNWSLGLDAKILALSIPSLVNAGEETL